jgi:formate dehydrogenase subunit gamma
MDAATVTPALTADERVRVDACIAALANLPGALLPVLHAVQHALGFVPPAAVPLIAERLNLSRAEVHGVASFYPDFHYEPRGRHVVQVCRAEACQAVGSRALEAHATKALGCGMHATTADGAVTLEPVYCLGNCACGPSVRIGDDVHGRVDAARFDALIEKLRGNV